MGVSSWGLQKQISSDDLDQIEVAALLHDIGKIGVPDRVLLKPGKLSREEQVAIDRHRHVGEEILTSCCCSNEILEIVKYSVAWFDGSRHGFEDSGDTIHQGARMLTIVDAFDAMTTDHVYRRAMSRERAIAELFACAGSQFDPKLVEEFAELISADLIGLNERVARRWLETLTPEDSNQLWRLSTRSENDNGLNVDQLFHYRLLDSMQDGVVFVDTNLQILLWNQAAERLTGIAGPQRHAKNNGRRRWWHCATKLTQMLKMLTAR